jgi:hypothetical protein
MSAERKKKRSAEELWRVLEDEAASDEMERIGKLSSKEVDDELRAAGIDPDRVGAAGAAYADRMNARRDRELHPANELERAKARLRARTARRGKMSRSELQGRIDALRNDPALPAPARVLFRNKTEEEASDAELESLLSELEDLVEEHEKK